MDLAKWWNTKGQLGRVGAAALRLPAQAFPPFWREVLREMLDSYDRRCAYLAM